MHPFGVKTPFWCEIHRFVLKPLFGVKSTVLCINPPVVWQTGQTYTDTGVYRRTPVGTRTSFGGKTRKCGKIRHFDRFGSNPH